MALPGEFTCAKITAMESDLAFHVHIRRVDSPFRLADFVILRSYPPLRELGNQEDNETALAGYAAIFREYQEVNA